MIIKLSGFWVALAIAAIGLGTYGIYWVLKFIFAQSILLGIVFLFFGLPMILRLFFVTLFGFLAASKHKTYEHEDGVIDVKGKIVK